MSCSTIISPIEVLVADDLGRRRDWTNEEKIRIVEESLQGFRQGSAAARRYIIAVLADPVASGIPQRTSERTFSAGFCCAGYLAPGTAPLRCKTY